ncbi:MAG: inositol monophosphatase family protein, partial [Halobacteriota archaeon]
YAVSIALVRDDEPVVGVVYAPETDELFSAIKGGHAYRDGKRIMTTEREQLSESVFMSGYDPEGTFLAHFYNVTRGVRRLGSVSLHLCYLASGSCDATWEYDTYPWDTAAGVVIARAAGAKLTDSAGEPYTVYGEGRHRNELVGSNGPLHDAVLAHLRTHDGLGESGGAD